jgi:protocatechuate 3,4-dioxygenase alpha subunit
MKLIPTASQTVGPFFSIGLSPLCQQEAQQASTPAGTIAIKGKIFDGEKTSIPDAVVEFWSNGEFVRVATNQDGSFSALLKQPSDTLHFDVLIFMRGLMRPVLTRCYIGERSEREKEIALKQVSAERLQTLLARAEGTLHNYLWDIHMQGENETVFFDF